MQQASAGDALSPSVSLRMCFLGSVNDSPICLNCPQLTTTLHFSERESQPSPGLIWSCVYSDMNLNSWPAEITFPSNSKCATWWCYGCLFFLFSGALWGSFSIFINLSIELHKQPVEGHCLVYSERGYMNSSLDFFLHVLLFVISRQNLALCRSLFLCRILPCS